MKRHIIAVAIAALVGIATPQYLWATTRAGYKCTAKDASIYECKAGRWMTYTVNAHRSCDPALATDSCLDKQTITQCGTMTTYKNGDCLEGQIDQVKDSSCPDC